jgi:hypothetical protein
LNVWPVRLLGPEDKDERQAVDFVHLRPDLPEPERATYRTAD